MSVAEDKRKWPAGQTHSISYDFLCAHAAIKHRLCFGTPFLSAKKGGKKRQGAKPPEPPGILIFRAIVGHHNGG